MNPSESEYKNHLNKYYNEKVDVYHSTYTGEGRYPTAKQRLMITMDLLAQMNPKPEKILDVGCGDARAVIETTNAGYFCIGFDFSEGMVKLGKQLLTEANLSEDLIKTGDIYKIPYKDNHFDTLLCLGVVENLPNYSDIFSEFRRVLKPRGRIIISLDNHLFSLFTFNKHTIQFYKELFDSISLPKNIRDKVLKEFGHWFHVENVKQIARPIEDVQINKEGIKIPKYNALNVHEGFNQLGFQIEKLRYYHYHPIPPRFEKDHPDLFRSFAEALETPQDDWRGGILCNQMLIQAKVT